MKHLQRLLTVLLATSLALAMFAAGPADATHPEGGQPIHPGVRVNIGDSQCTANFVFTDDSGDVYLGTAAHCAGTDPIGTNVDGCEAGSLPLGTPVQIEGADKPGELVYSSWLTMQAVGEDRSDPCLYNDFALVELSTEDTARVSPALPVSDGPVDVETEGTTEGEKLYSYGASSLRRDVQKGTPRQGTSLGTSAGGWLHTALFGSPGVPGDSGAAVVNSEGYALGILTNLNLAPLAGTNGVGDLYLALQYLNDKADTANARLNQSQVVLVTGPVPFEAPTPTQSVLGGGSGGLVPGVGELLDLPLLGR